MSPLIRIDGVAISDDDSIVFGTTDGGSVRAVFRTSREVGMLFAATASVVGPFWVEAPDLTPESIEEIDPGAGDR